MNKPLILPRNCGNCQHWDGDKWCSLPWREVLIQGPTNLPAQVVCAKHKPQEPEIEEAAV